jgi:hypothetical protein
MRLQLSLLPLSRLLFLVAMSHGLALGLAACSKPSDLVPGAVAGGHPSAPWQPQLSVVPGDAARHLSDGEGELVMASAIAAHERRRP